MWTRKKGNIGPVDSKIVKRDFIIAESYGSSYGFLHKNEESNPFKRSINVPMFYIFKVHKNHPMRIFSSSQSFTYIYPAKEDDKKKPRMPAEVYDDRLDYDLAKFMLVPFNVNEKNIGKWEKTSIKEGFVSELGRRHDVSLLYGDYGASINGQDYLRRVSEVSPSKIINHFYSWLYEGGKIFSHNRTFNQKLEGRVDIPVGNLIPEDLFRTLEKRYNTKLLFEH